MNTVTKDYLDLASHLNIAAWMEKPTVNTGTFFPTPTELFTVPQAGKVFQYMERDLTFPPCWKSLPVPGMKPYLTQGSPSKN
jgi:hypothetical protein